TGSAAVPAARCRNFRRGSFTITSSAHAQCARSQFAKRMELGTPADGTRTAHLQKLRIRHVLDGSLPNRLPQTCIGAKGRVVALHDTNRCRLPCRLSGVERKCLSHCETT